VQRVGSNVGSLFCQPFLRWHSPFSATVAAAEKNAVIERANAAPCVNLVSRPSNRATDRRALTIGLTDVEDRLEC
jgi:hypothetical protein